MFCCFGGGSGSGGGGPGRGGRSHAHRSSSPSPSPMIGKHATKEWSNHGIDDLAYDKLGTPLLLVCKKGPEAVLLHLCTLQVPVGEWMRGQMSALRTRARALALAIDAVVHPLLDEVDRQVGVPSADEVDGVQLSWQDVEVNHIKNLLSEAGSGMYSKKEFGRWSGVVQALQMLFASLHQVWGAVEAAQQWHLVPQPTFLSAAANRLMGMVAVVYTRNVTLESVAAVQRRSLHWRELCEAVGLREKHLAVALNPSSKALMVYMTSGEEGQKKLDLRVRRAEALSDACSVAEDNSILDAAQDARCCYKVFPQFVGEDGLMEHGEGHGPRKEFFVLVAASAVGAPADAQAPASNAPDGNGPTTVARSHPALFTYNRSAGAYWFNVALTASPRLRQLYRFFGWIMGQAMCNRCTLGVPLPELLFRILLVGPAEFAPSIEMLRDFDPEMAQSILNTEKLSDKDFKGMLEMEGCSGLTKKEYIANAVEEALKTSIAWQAREMLDGLNLSIDLSLLKTWAVTASDLGEMVCGPSGVDESSVAIREVFRVVLDEELTTTYAPLVESLWQVLEAWPVGLRRKFIMFVTGSDRLPLRGTELLRIELPFVAVNSADHEKHLKMLPQAHTCENILELPNYWESLVVTKRLAIDSIPKDRLNPLKADLLAILDDRLQMAVTMCNGYGLDSVESSSPRASGGAPLHHPGNPVQSQASSYTGLQYSFQQTPSVLDLNMSPVAPKINFMGKKNKIHPIEGSGHSEILFADTPNAGRGTEASHSGSTLSALDAPSLSWADNPRKAGGSRLTPILPSIPKDYIDNMLNSNMSESDMDTLMNSVETTNVGVGGNNLTGVDKTARQRHDVLKEKSGSAPSLDDMIAELSLE